jgi:hypothetical protein
MWSAWPVLGPRSLARQSAWWPVVHKSFISYRNQRYAILPLALVLGAVLVYATDSPREPPSGSTWLGYTLGTIAALLVFYLALYGVRRRSFHSPTGSASGWLSAHVYLGIAALAIATLHCAFQFGRNVHTLAYALLLFVVLSGCWGVYVYAKYPGLMLRRRGHVNREVLLAQLVELDRRARFLAADLDDRVRQLVDEAIRRTQLGGSVWAQLRARDRSAILVGVDDKRGSRFQVVSNEGQHVLIDQLAHEHAATHDASYVARLQELLEVAGEKAVLVGRVQKDIQLQALLQFWLYIHLPLCFGLLTALVIHVLAAFLYW